MARTERAARSQCLSLRLTQNRPAKVLVGFVVFVFPSVTTAITTVRGDGGLTRLPLLFTVSALHQFGMTWRTAPILLNARTGFAQVQRFHVVGTVGICHQRASFALGRGHDERAHEKSTWYQSTKCFFAFYGGTSGGRTHDKRIKSPLLYQLSYGPFAAVTVPSGKPRIITLFFSLQNAAGQKVQNFCGCAHAKCGGNADHRSIAMAIERTIPLQGT